MKNTVALHKRRDKRSFENLEKRMLLAGDVWAFEFNGYLLIRGDAKDNIVCIEGDYDKIRITGTKTNIKGSDCFNLDDICRGIWIDMKGGHDDLKIKNLELPGRSVSINLGSGNDKLWMECITACADICIYGDAGNDSVTVTKSFIDGNLGIRGCDGNEKIDLNRLFVIGAVCIDTDKGNDTVALYEVLIKDLPQNGDIPGSGAGGGFAAAIAGNEIAKAGGFDKDWFKKISDCCCQLCCGLEIKTGKDKDTVKIEYSCVDCYTWIDTDGGADKVEIKKSDFGQKRLVYDLQIDTIEQPHEEECCERSGLGIQTGGDKDIVDLCDNKVIGQLLIDTTGNCYRFVNGMVEINSQAIAQNRKKTVADGDDCVTLKYVCVESTCDFYPTEFLAGTADVVDPSGCCECGELLIFTGNGKDKVTLDYVFTDCKAFISTSDFCKLDGADCVTITNSCFNKGGRIDPMITSAIEGGGYRCIGLVVWTGAGDDCVTVCDVHVIGGVKICTDGGKDKVWVEKLCADSLFCDTGADADWLGIRWSECCWVCVDGGSGKDTFAKTGNYFDHLYNKNCEILTA